MNILVTHTHPGSYWFPIWDKYYKGQFDEYLIIKRTDKDIYEDYDKTATFNATHPVLLKTYDWVMIADVDEIVVPNPDKYKNLRDYMEKQTAKSVRCRGHNVIEMSGDKPLDLSKKITDQRTHWLVDDTYDKPVLTRVPLRYSWGHHGVQERVAVDEDLVMLHLRDAFMAKAVQRRADAKAIPYSTGEFLKRRKKAVSIPEKWRVI